MDQARTNIKDNIKNKKKTTFRTREECFIRNGAILLEKQIAFSQGQDTGSGQLKFFTQKDIEKATNNFDVDLVLGSSAHRSVYKATIEDRNVVIGVPLQIEPTPKMTDRNLTEAGIAMVMNHDNMAKIYGCCLETFVPILVYEVLPNGSLSQHLHDDCASSKRMKWTDSLRIATDAAYALSYMHNALRKPVVHRGVSSISVLLDRSFHAKLGNFGYAVAITPGDTSERFPFQGSAGYVDPEYIQTQVVTEKCDVYSFGVLMLEILTRRSPSRMNRGGRDLVDLFTSAVEKKCTMKMIDSAVLEQASHDEIQKVVQLALKCVAKKGDQRPSMIEIVEQLWQIQGRKHVTQRNK